jgi:hypothetical protein
MISKSKKYNNIQNKILRLGLVIPGTIRKIYLKCGKENCRCMSGNEADRHGPYFFWDRKVNGRLSSLSISKEDLPYYERGIANRQKLERLFAEALSVGEHLATQFKKRRVPKFKKTPSSTRGK